MNEPNNLSEQNLLERAIKAFGQETQIAVEVQVKELPIDRMQIDAVLRINGNQVFAEVKNWLPQTNLGAVMQKLRRIPAPQVLVGDYVNPRMAEKLKENDIFFMDTVGNAYLKFPNTHVYVTGNRPIKDARRQALPTGRAFSTAGLKVVFRFLCEPDRVDAPYRDIAVDADVAIGTVARVVRDLHVEGYLTKRKTGRKLKNAEKLLNRWVETYPGTLKPKLRIGDFQAPDAKWWTGLQLERFGAYWGGEIAAQQMTEYLRHEVATIYIYPGDAPNTAAAPDALRRLIKDARLRKATRDPIEAGLVQVYRAFWRPGLEHGNMVHPILTYADLVATADPRNLEVARLVLRDHIDERFWKD